MDRPRGTGGVTRKPDGRYQASVTRRGRRIYRTAATSDEALAKLDLWLARSVRASTAGLRHHTRRDRALTVVAAAIAEWRRVGWADGYLARVLVAQLSPRRIKRGISGPCVYCGTWIASTVDHVVPRNFGGTDDPANLASACWSCNSRKGDRPAEVMSNTDGSQIGEVA